MSLLRRIFLANAAIFAFAAVALVISPATVSFPVAATEAAVMVAGLVAILALNLVVLRRTLRPLDRPTGAMGDVDLLRPGQRISVDGGGSESSTPSVHSRSASRASRGEAGSHARLKAELAIAYGQQRHPQGG